MYFKMQVPQHYTEMYEKSAAVPTTLKIFYLIFMCAYITLVIFII